MRLGGWWRLWVVLAATWTVAVAVWTWQTWPQKLDLVPLQPEDDRTMQVDLSKLPDQPMLTVQQQHGLTAFTLWAIPPLTLLVSAYSVRWVYRGFRTKRSS